MNSPSSDTQHKGAGVAAAAGTDVPTKTSANASTGDDDDYDNTDAPRSSSKTLQEKAAATAPIVGDMDLWKQLELEKSRYPGASTWAPDEERLFELLFFREGLPILPSHWELDLRAVPISEANFADAEKQPIVYAHSKDFLATRALVRLIELTAAIRTTSESGLHHRVPGMIKEGLDRFLAWAAEDGGYHHRRVVPNIITEVVDTLMLESDITDLLQGRMRALARLQREYLREDRDPNFWHGTSSASTTRTAANGNASSAAAAAADRDHLLLQRYLSPRRKRHANKYRHGKAPKWRRRSDNAMEDELAGTPHHPHTGGHFQDAAAPRRRRTFASPASELDELARPGDGDRMRSSPAGEHRLLSSPSTTGTCLDGGGPAVRYRRQPPVVYGFFILNSSVFILTADASLGDHAYVSFHVEADFMEHRQSVWNALTLAMVACLARDEMRLRADDFEPQPEEEDSDPDL
ncbi:hypothetical protein IF1G_00690 [Cordyceps javanica]|uniref:Uncharacterized protein n=1 Tax=Cordyceps javanica TaxID=43265 RepID=A0A545WD85_9HYPO|nr:hypothetical protein IF1G_00690 [Cordyceps javanica]TQW11939.1 hypothetical protein IF2G_00670 [Cordyceps javanica]